MCLYYSCKYNVNLYPANFSVVTISKSYFICMLRLCHLFPADISGCLLSSRENCLLLLYISTAYLMLSTKHTSSHSSVTHRNKFIPQDMPSLVFHWSVGGEGNRITGAFQLGLRQSCLVSKKMLITVRFCCTSREDTHFHTWVGLNNHNTAYAPPLRRKQLLKLMHDHHMHFLDLIMQRNIKNKIIFYSILWSYASLHSFNYSQ